MDCAVRSKHHGLAAGRLGWDPKAKQAHVYDGSGVSKIIGDGSYYKLGKDVCVVQTAPTRVLPVTPITPGFTVPIPTPVTIE